MLQHSVAAVLPALDQGSPWPLGTAAVLNLTPGVSIEADCIGLEIELIE